MARPLPPPRYSGYVTKKLIFCGFPYLLHQSRVADPDSYFEKAWILLLPMGGLRILVQPEQHPDKKIPLKIRVFESGSSFLFLAGQIPEPRNLPPNLEPPGTLEPWNLEPCLKVKKKHFSRLSLHVMLQIHQLCFLNICGYLRLFLNKKNNTLDNLCRKRLLWSPLQNI